MVYSAHMSRFVRWFCTLAVIAGCSSTEEPPPVRSNEPLVEVIREPVLRPDAHTPGTDANLINVDVFEDRLIFTYDGTPQIAPAVGQVVAGVEGGGYLRRLLSVANEGNRYEAATEHAYLADFFEDLHVRLTFEPASDAWVETGLAGRRTDALGGSINLIKTEVAPGCSLASGAVEVGADFRPQFDMDLDISFFSGTKFYFEVGGDLTVFTKLNSGAASLSCAWDQRFDSLSKEFTSTFFVGPVPVVVTHTIVPRGAYSLSGSVEVPRVEFEASANIAFNAGARYEDGEWTSVADGSRSGAGRFTINEGGNVAITTRLTAGIEYQAKLYDLAGPQLSVGPHIEAHAESDFCEWNANADVGLQLTVGARLDIPVFDVSLADYTSDPIDLVSGTFWERDGTWPWCEDAGMGDAGVRPDAGGGGGTDAGPGGGTDAGPGTDTGVTDPCNRFSGCDACNTLEAEGCSYCGNTGTCMSDSRVGECSGNWQNSPSSCVDCSGYGDCDSCADDGYCGWCPGMGCLNDRSDEAEACGAAYQTVICR